MSVTPFKCRFFFIGCSLTTRKPSEIMRLFVTTFIGVVFGFFIGVSFPTLSITKVQTEYLLPPYGSTLRSSKIFNDFMLLDLIIQF